MTASLTIALAGNPNSGKTTLFNTLTGSRQHVGNYPGITVDTREGHLHFNGQALTITDLPGTYSLTAYSPEEIVARNILIEQCPQVVIDVVDATNLERNLYLSVQLMELGVPVIIALNMMDEADKQGLHIDTEALAAKLGAGVVKTVGRTGRGKPELLQKCIDLGKEVNTCVREPLFISYGPDLDPVIEDMTQHIAAAGFLTEWYPARWVALKYLESDAEVMAQGARQGSIAQELEAMVHKVSQHCEKTLNTDPEAIIADYRYGFISSLLKTGVLTRDATNDRRAVSETLDRFLTHRIAGPVIMFLVIYVLFQITFEVGEIPMGWVEHFFAWLGGLCRSLTPPGLVRSLLVSGIIDGVGGVLTFVPLIMIMFFGLAFLEDSGYMARIAYMLDRVFRAFGLHGNSVMPFVISGGIPGGCAVPGCMATRALRSPKEKIATLLTAPFLSCGAKVPVFLLLAGAFFPTAAAEVLFWITLVGWAAALLVARLLRSTLIRGKPTPFVMELPPYRMPTLQGLIIHTWERAWQYIKKAGTIILAISILLWAAMTFPGLPQEQKAVYETDIQATQQALTQAADAKNQELANRLSRELKTLQGSYATAKLKYSLAGRLGTFFESVTRFAGFDWRTNIALIGGFAAKEVIVSTLGTSYSLGSVDPETSASLSDRLKANPGFTMSTGLSLMVFVLLYAPCFVTVITIARESTWKWAVFSILFNTVLAYALAVAVFQTGKLL
ncbi:MAG: ferrous iron transport protein B [Desulfohalobiaceae bacterium]|nr:ferrous iron transport protein B [Desulfohalobiaceae bacterium]